MTSSTDQGLRRDGPAGSEERQAPGRLVELSVVDLALIERLSLRK